MNASKVMNNGPFGTAQRTSVAHVLNALVEYGIPLRVVKEINEVHNGVIEINGYEFGKYRYFDNIEQPLFYFDDKSHMRQPSVTDPETGISKTAFRLNVTFNGIPCLWVNQNQSTPEFRDFISNKFFTCDCKEHSYVLGVAAGAVDNDNDGNYCIEFLNSEGIQDFVNYVNENYNVQKGLQEQQTFTVSTYEHRVAAHARYSKYFTRVSEKNNKVMADFDDITDANELFKALQALDVPVFKNFMV
jgi:hypothetical protein